MQPSKTQLPPGTHPSKLAVQSSPWLPIAARVFLIRSKSYYCDGTTTVTAETPSCVPFTHLSEPQSLISLNVVPASLLVGLRRAAEAAAVEGGPVGRMGGHRRTTPPHSLSQSGFRNTNMLTRRAAGPDRGPAPAAGEQQGCWAPSCCCCCGGEVPVSAVLLLAAAVDAGVLLLLLLPASCRPSSGGASLWRGTGRLPAGSWHKQYSALPLLRSRTNSLKSSCDAYRDTYRENAEFGDHVGCFEGAM